MAVISLPAVPMEHERKFLIPDIKVIPVPFYNYPMEYIVQGYLEDKDGSRLRQSFSYNKCSFLHTRKSGSGVSRKEIEKPLTEKEFKKQWKMVKCFLNKSRYRILQDDGLTVELDIFHGLLASLVYAEVEFGSREEAMAFKPYAWLGKEVTNRKKYGNYSLAKYGLPQES